MALKKKKPAKKKNVKNYSRKNFTGSERIGKKMEHGRRLDEPRQIADFMKPFAKSNKEQTFSLYLDRNNRVIRIDFTATGTEKGVLVCFDDVVKSALNFKKCAVINMHTHPGSNVNPSVVDIRTVYNECCIFYYNDINYIDHIIINGKGQYFSFAEKGIIKQFKSEIKRLQKLILEDLVPEK